MNGSVIVGYDASPWSERALTEGAAEAAARGGGLVIVHAFHRLAPAEPALPGTELSTRELAEKTVAEGAAGIRGPYPGMDIQTRVVDGHPAYALAEASRDADVLVVGNRGRGGFAELLLGSVSHRVLAHASCPVVVVRGELRTRRDRVLALVDIDAPCDDLLEFAFAEAARRGARLTAANVWDGAWHTAVTEVTDTAGEADAFETEHDARLATLVRPWQAEYPEVHTIRRIGVGSVSDVAVKATDDADLVVVGGRKQGEGHHGMRVGPIASAILHHATCPVAVVPVD
jgi:nucleotide-binding universal stress UspA family protein